KKVRIRTFLSSPRAHLQIISAASNLTSACRMRKTLREIVASAWRLLRHNLRSGKFIDFTFALSEQSLSHLCIHKGVP
ncbi:hypothetical protein COCCADRAFT_105930, partial [Bipolaris zeicola 26-R-13]